MRFKSTRNSELRFSASQVISQGISDEGGLFVPEFFPNVIEELSVWAKLDYNSLAERILALYLTDFTKEEINHCVSSAYSSDKFEGDQPVAIHQIQGGPSVLELWHGPTCAFKDMALQLLPQLLSVAMKKETNGKTALILVATSGDTGKAALEGFKDVPGTKIVSFYPEDGVSELQKLQMITQSGKNVSVCAVKGNFDDTQTGVKNIFADEEICNQAESSDLFLSSANSINFGRLLPQIIYYFYSYFALHKEGKIQSLMSPVNIVVPTGNFGNILAGYYASRMGLPVNKFICASNDNNVLTDFINTGCYDKKRKFYTTASPSMDILVSSNLERLIYHLCGEDCRLTSSWMKGLSVDGEYLVDKATAAEVIRLFHGGYCTDSQTKQTIGEMFEKSAYLCDTHTAVAMSVYQKYLYDTQDQTPTIVVSTASPYKFSDNVLRGLNQPVAENAFEQLADLEAYTNTPIQAQLKNLEGVAIRFKDCIEIHEMKQYIKEKILNWEAGD